MTTLYRPYVTLDDVKFYCGIGSTDTSKDENIKIAINKASRYIDGVTGRYYYKKTYTSEYLNGTKSYQGWQIFKTDDGGLIATPQAAPIIDVTELIESSATLVENTDFYLHKETGLIERKSGNWSEVAREIKITCNLGYDSANTAVPSTDIPGDVAQYALEIAARLSGHYKKEIKNYVSGAAERVDLYGVPKEIETALRNLRPVAIA
jgi:hypothetical protein